MNATVHAAQQLWERVLTFFPLSCCVCLSFSKCCRVRVCVCLCVLERVCASECKVILAVSGCPAARKSEGLLVDTYVCASHTVVWCHPGWVFVCLCVLCVYVLYHFVLIIITDIISKTCNHVGKSGVLDWNSWQTWFITIWSSLNSTWVSKFKVWNQLNHPVFFIKLAAPCLVEKVSQYETEQEALVLAHHILVHKPVLVIIPPAVPVHLSHLFSQSLLPVMVHMGCFMFNWLMLTHLQQGHFRISTNNNEQFSLLILLTLYLSRISLLNFNC